MNSNQLMTAGAVAFAGFAIFYVLRKPKAQATLATTAQQQRDAGLQQWFNHFDTQAAEWAKGIDYSLATLAPKQGLWF